MPSLRHLPPVHSPVDATAALRAVLTRSPRDPVRELERLLAERFSADGVILCGSGTQALQLALYLARTAAGRHTAALPAYTSRMSVVSSPAPVRLSGSASHRA